MNHICPNTKYAYVYNWAAYVGHMHTYSCLKTLIWVFFASVSLFLFHNMPLFWPSIMFLSPCFSIWLLVCLWHARLGFLFNDFFVFPWTHIQMSMHWCIGAKMQWGKWGKACSHINMHLFCALVMDMNMLDWMIRRDIYQMFSLILPCIYFCLCDILFACCLGWDDDMHDRCMLVLIWVAMIGVC